MINNKQINKIVLALVGLSLLACALIVYLAHMNTNSKVTAYESKLFGDEILSIDISVDEADWQGLLDNPTAKEYIAADLTINGETFSSVGIRTKGNSSLTQVAQMADSDRYSIHFKFDQYQKGQTYYGLDTFCINNLVGDNTYMKDYIAYDIMDYIGVPTPLKNYAKVTLNGEDFGFYLALERYEKSFLDRVYDTSGGQLYNVKIQMGQREEFMEGGGGQREEFIGGDDPRDMRGGAPNDMKGGSPETMSGGAPGGMGGGGPDDMKGDRPGGMGGDAPDGMDGGRGGGDLVYTDDNIDSYSSIFDNAEFKGNSDKDKQRVIEAIKNLSEGTDLEEYFDVDEILRYLAAHTVVVNLDSYSSSMAQNYYIYERDGKISILPWDYGLSFGGFQSSDADSVINFPIDTPVSGVSMEERPLIDKLLEIPEYKEKYHTYLSQIVEGYFNSGLFEETITALDAKINEYVKNDTTSFTTYENYSASLPVLIKLGILRVQSIEGQLEGTIPSTSEGQAANKDSLINGDEIDLSALGSFMGGAGGRGGRGDRESDLQNMHDMTEIREIMSILQESDGQISPELRNQLLELGLTDEQIDQIESLTSNTSEGGFESRGDRGNFPGQNSPGGQGGPTGNSNTSIMDNTTATTNTDSASIVLTGILLLIMLIAACLLWRFKRMN